MLVVFKNYISHKPTHSCLVVVWSILGASLGELALRPCPEPLDRHLLRTVGAVEHELDVVQLCSQSRLVCAMDS
ncbi:MAG: hypothetical protein OSA04_07800 [Flavobacteriales bacterium]|nr:hypothetical protein [Flavobacteriales bacterium]